MFMPFELAEDRGDKIRELRNANTISRINNIELYILAPDSKIKKNLYRISTLGLKRGIMRQLLIFFLGFFKCFFISIKYKPDIFLIRGDVPLYITWFIKKTLKIPFIIDLFSVDESVVINWFEIQKKKGFKYIDINQDKSPEKLKTNKILFIRKLNNSLALNNSSLFTMEMDYQRKILQDMGVDNKKLFKLLPSIEFDEKVLDSDSKIIYDAIFIGSLDDAHLRMIEPVVDGIERIVTKYPDFRMVIVGGGPLENVLKDKVKKLGYSENIIFKGRLPNKSVIDILRQSRIALSYSTGQKCYEYCALGKPVLAFDGTNTRNVLKDAALYADTWDEYIDNLIILLKDDEKYKELSSNARKLAESRSIEKIAADFKRKLEEIMDRKI